jgi:N-acetyl-gamma-glutamylphosphate reductase
MPKYAVLGATGQTGSELVKFLSTRTDVHLHIYARSQSRLDEKLPDINLDRCTTFVGSIEDTDLISNCIRSTDAVFAVVATNVNQPKCYVARQTADSIIKALKVLSNESENTFVCPTIVFL